MATLVATPIVQQFSDLSAYRVFRRCVSISALISLLLTLRWQGRSLSNEGLFLSHNGLKDFNYGILLGVGGLIGMLIIGLMTNVCMIRIHPDTAKVVRTVLLFIPGALLVGVLEELVFRGFLLRVMSQINSIFAIILTNVIYAFVHLKSTQLNPALWREMVGLFLFGLLLTLAVKRSHHLWLAIGLHAALAYGARVNKLIVAIPDSSWTWWVGTSRLINGVASWILLGLIAFCIIKLTAHRGRTRHENS